VSRERTESREERHNNRLKIEVRVENRKHRAKSREQRAESREQRAESKHVPQTSTSLFV
jgi:hypothetical protein